MAKQEYVSITLRRENWKRLLTFLETIQDAGLWVNLVITEQIQRALKPSMISSRPLSTKAARARRPRKPRGKRSTKAPGTSTRS